MKSASYVDLPFESDGKGKLMTTLYTTNAMTSHSVLSTFLSFVATSLQHLHLEFLYYSLKVMPELAEIVGTFFTVLDFLQLIFWNAKRFKSSLQKLYGRHHELVDRYSVSICTMKTDLFNGS